MTILFGIIGIILGYCIGETVIYTQRRKLLQRARIIHELEMKILRYEKYVPITEIKKEEIINLHKGGLNGRQIGELVHIDDSAINRALHRWNIR